MKCACIILSLFFYLRRTDAKPNILFILAGKACVICCKISLLHFVKTDDMGYGDLRVYPNPNSPHGRLDTPYLDRLAQQSMMFTDAYAGGTVCAPSRCALVGTTDVLLSHLCINFCHLTPHCFVVSIKFKHSNHIWYKISNA